MMMVNVSVGNFASEKLKSNEKSKIVNLENLC